jgi:hypothetical protein
MVFSKKYLLNVYCPMNHFKDILSWGVHGRVVKVVDFKPLVPYRCGFESRQGFLILSFEEAIQLAKYGGATQVSLHQ